MNDEEFVYHFPFETPRNVQKLISQAVIKAFKDGFKYVVLQAPTGVGKSPIAYAVSSYMEEQPIVKNLQYNGSYILTSMKGLQDQYMKDFNHLENKTLNTVKGKANYMCINDKSNNTTCEMGACTKRSSKDHKSCPYVTAREWAYKSDMTVLNYSYFLNMTYEISIQPAKQLLILDECHNIEGQLLKFASVEIITKVFKDLNLTIPKFPSIRAKDSQMIEWLSASYIPAIKNLQASVQVEMEGLHEGEMDYQHLKHQDVFLANMIGMVVRLLSQHTKGITIVVDRDGNKSIGFKPLKADIYSKDFLFNFGSKILMMSATVMNIKHFCDTLGLNPKEVKYLKVASPFPLDRRPIVNCAKFALKKANMEEYKYDLAQQVRELLETHKNERGVIHSQSYDLANFLVQELKDPRLFIPRGGGRDLAIQEFLNDPLADNGVIVSPSLKEGFDFKDDFARFCILLKAPYANLGDNFVKKRFNEDPNWYYMEALRDVIQSTGRVVRHDKDYAVTYFLDKNIMRLIMNNRTYVPKYWLDSIISPANFKWEPEKFK